MNLSQVCSAFIYVASLAIGLRMLYRHRFADALSSRPQVGASMSRRDPQPGDAVIVKMFDARTVKGHVCVGGILNTTRGIRVRVRSGDAVYLVNYEQVRKATKREVQP